MLLSAKCTIKKTHYEVLCVKEDASYDEIRASYRAAILNSHPDKQHPQNQKVSDHHCNLQESFLDVQKAWGILCDPMFRANYDEELQASREDLEVAADEVEMQEMMVESIGDVHELQYQCRCGDYFSITSLELRELGISFAANEKVELQKPTNSAPTSVLLPCGSCSLKIRLMLDVDC